MALSAKPTWNPDYEVKTFLQESISDLTEMGFRLLSCFSNWGIQNHRISLHAASASFGDKCIETERKMQNL